MRWSIVTLDLDACCRAAGMSLFDVIERSLRQERRQSLMVFKFKVTIAFQKGSSINRLRA